MKELIEKGKKAREAAYFLAQVSSLAKDKVLNRVAEALVSLKGTILSANESDMENARQAGLKGAIIDRLLLTEQRIASMAEGLEQIALLEDPVGEIISMKKRPNGLSIGQKRVPIGVIGIIYESRPNVTADVFGLCLKTGNAAILRGGKEAYNSNRAVTSIIQKVIGDNGFPSECLQLVEDTSRESAVALMKLEEYLDLLIPRGGAGLIRAVVENSHVPVIETGVGNCHIFVDESADLEKAVAITVNAKTQRPGVCNAAESLLVHEWLAEKFLPLAGKDLAKHKVEIRGDEKVCEILSEALPAKEEDWGTEFLDLILSVKVVSSMDEAIGHIQTYGSGHSEAILTENYSNAQEFLNKVDAAAVYVNASTRFTDGFEFGFGAEIGISTQKLHARGPMGLKELTSTKYIIYGDGQIRE
ncbi:MAG: glutamate-5-semialdehyde dehydrogenase [Bacteroidales bacterium]|nr:glutamate-5-semialdehyde dehydrogenase [Bacteroidales bacterium]